MTEPRTDMGENLQNVEPNVTEGLSTKKRLLEEKLKEKLPEGEGKLPEEKLSEEKFSEGKPLVRKPDLSAIEVYAFVGPARTGKNNRRYKKSA